MKIHKIKVKNRETKYPIFIGSGALNLLRGQIKSTCPQTKKIALILDKNVPNQYKKKSKEHYQIIKYIRKNICQKKI